MNTVTFEGYRVSVTMGASTARTLVGCYLNQAIALKAGMIIGDNNTAGISVSCEHFEGIVEKNTIIEKTTMDMTEEDRLLLFVFRERVYQRPG
jgi:hypothetical protein